MAMIGTLISVICGIGALAIGTASAADLPDPAQLRERISARASVMAEYRNMMNNPDPNVAGAAFAIMVESGDPVARTFAIEEAIVSSENFLRHMGLKIQVLDRDTVMIEAGENFEKTFQVKLRDKNILTGNFITGGGATSSGGHIIGEQLEISDDECRAVLRFDGDKYFIGTMSLNATCREKEPITVPARVRAR